MFDLKTIINSAGIFLTIAGVFIVYKNSPINEWLIDGGDFSTNFDDIKKKTERKNHLIGVGVYTVIFGSVLQLVSNFIPSETP